MSTPTAIAHDGSAGEYPNVSACKDSGILVHMDDGTGKVRIVNGYGRWRARKTILGEEARVLVTAETNGTHANARILLPPQDGGSSPVDL